MEYKADDEPAPKEGSLGPSAGAPSQALPMPSSSKREHTSTTIDLSSLPDSPETEQELRDVQHHIDEIYSGLHIRARTVATADFIADTLYNIQPGYVPLRNSGDARRSGLEVVAALFVQTTEPRPACPVRYQSLQAEIIVQLEKFFAEPKRIEEREAYSAEQVGSESWEVMQRYTPEVYEVGYLTAQTITTLLVLLCYEAGTRLHIDGFTLNIVSYHRKLGRVTWAEEVCRFGRGRFVFSLRRTRGRWEAYGPSNGAAEPSADGRALKVTEAMEWGNPVFNGGRTPAHQCGERAVRELDEYYRNNIAPGSQSHDPIVIDEDTPEPTEEEQRKT